MALLLAVAVVAGCNSPRSIGLAGVTSADGYMQVPRACVEASPDVLRVLRAPAAAEPGIPTTSAAIERTQAINLLREAMYRTCERYLSGAISREAFVVQAGRDWRAVLAILAIEQLTRTATRPAAPAEQGPGDRP